MIYSRIIYQDSGSCEIYIIAVFFPLYAIKIGHFICSSESSLEMRIVHFCICLSNASKRYVVMKPSGIVVLLYKLKKLSSRKYSTFFLIVMVKFSCRRLSSGCIVVADRGQEHQIWNRVVWHLIIRGNNAKHILNINFLLNRLNIPIALFVLRHTKKV